MKKIVLIIGLLFSIGLLAQRPPSQTEHQKIDQIYEIFQKAYELKNAEMMDHLYTDDCLYLPGSGSSIEKGEQAITGFKQMFERGQKKGMDYKISFKFVERVANENWGHDVGYYKLVTTTKEGKKSEGYGKFVIVLKKEDDNIWRIHVDSYSATTKEAYNEVK